MVKKAFGKYLCLLKRMCVEAVKIKGEERKMLENRKKGKQSNAIFSEKPRNMDIYSLGRRMSDFGTRQYSTFVRAQLKHCNVCA
jgi:hypothetical protein